MFGGRGVYEEAYRQAFENNERLTKTWVDHKKNLEGVFTNLRSFPSKLSHQIMIPLGKKAMLKGRLMHTNEVLVNIGAGTFVKRSAQDASGVCNRMIERCEQQIEALKKEKDLLSSNKSMIENELFDGGSGRIDLIEPYNEEMEQKWRIAHRESVKKCKRNKHDEKNEEVTDEEIIKRLDYLQLREELEEDSSTSISSEDDSQEELDEVNPSEVQQDPGGDTHAENNKLKETETNLKPEIDKPRKKVSFKDNMTHEYLLDEAPKHVEDIPIINFYHTEENDNLSNRVEVPESETDIHDNGFPQIRTPTDIYKLYGSRSSPKKSILKKPKVTGNDLENVEVKSDISEAGTSAANEQEYSPAFEVFEKIREHKTDIAEISTESPNQRPISRFKASRQRKNTS